MNIVVCKVEQQLLPLLLTILDDPMKSK